MDGDRMTSIYVSVLLGNIPELKTDEEKKFYGKKKKYERGKK